MKKIAIIGTAGRGKHMTAAQWEWMLEQATNWIGVGNHLISGGAAWADHLAVKLYMTHKCEDLTLHLPAPWDFNNKEFVGGHGTSGSAANYYHSIFSRATGIDTRAEIDAVLRGGAVSTYQPLRNGYAAMFARNALVARECDGMLAFTFGNGDEPDDGGTRHTWDLCKSAHKKHFTIPS